MEYVFFYLIVGIVCGFVCKAIASGRGMEGGFWWGFWLGIIGIIIVAVRPNERQNTNITQSASSSFEDLEKLARLKEQGILTEEEYTKMKTNILKNF